MVFLLDFCSRFSDSIRTIICLLFLPEYFSEEEIKQDKTRPISPHNTNHKSTWYCCRWFPWFPRFGAQVWKNDRQGVRGGTWVVPWGAWYGGGDAVCLIFSGVPRLPGLEFGDFPDSNDFPFEFKKSWVIHQVRCELSGGSLSVGSLSKSRLLNL